MSDDRLRETIQAVLHLPFNKKMYEDAKTRAKSYDTKEHLEPQRCSSTQNAAYLYKVQVEINPETVSTVELDGEAASDRYSEQAKELIRQHQGSDQAKAALKKVSEDGAQVVPFWENCQDDAQLRANFSSERVVQITRPSDGSSGKLGTLHRLRIRHATIRNLKSRLISQTLDMDSLFESQEGASGKILSAIDQEKDRLHNELDDVRKAILNSLGEMWNELVEACYRDVGQTNSRYRDVAVADRIQLKADSERTIRNDFLTHDNKSVRDRAAKMIDIVKQAERVRGAM